jgi:hypothetical protein
MVCKLCLKARSEAYIWPRKILPYRFFVCLALGLASNFLAASGAQAGGLYLNEFATPSMGVAGAGAEAVANDASTNFALHNPAGMTRLEGHEIQLGAGLLQGDTKFAGLRAGPGVSCGSLWLAARVRSPR